MEKLIGKPVVRVEDERFLKGAGRFTDDIQFNGQLHAVFVRSTHAHARIKSIDSAIAAKIPGVQAFAHGETLAKVGFQPIDSLNRSPNFPVRNKDGSELPDVRRWPLARNKVRFVGEPVAVIAAETLQQAKDAAEAIIVDYEPLPSVVHAESAAQMPPVWDEVPENQFVDFESGDRSTVDAAIVDAFHVTKIRVDFPRHIVAFLEPRSVIARQNEKDGRLEIHSGSQSPHWIQGAVADMLNMPPEQIRFISPDTGGGFGARTSPYPEVAVVAWLAQFTGRPVKWTTERSESFTTDTQSRDHCMDVELAVNEEARMTAIRISSLWRAGAYLIPRSVWLHASYMSLMLCGVYRIPAAHYQLRGVFSNSASIGAFRGVARAEVSYALERAVDEAARELGIDRVTFRLNNVIRTADMPWTTVTGANYTAGDYEDNFRQLLALIDFDEYATRSRESREAGKYRGLGFSVFNDSVGGTPNEFVEIEVENDFVEIRVGTKSIGTGHETVFAQLMADLLQIPFEQLRIVDGDTDRVRTGSGTHASRSLRIAGTAMFWCTEELIEKGRLFASEYLEVKQQDVDYEEGQFTVRGTDRRVSLFDTANRMRETGQTLMAEHEHVTEGSQFSSGCQACEVEVDPETGVVTIIRLVAVSDPGKVINPLIAEGQVHGGIAQGLGHAVFEKAHYDRTTGQLITGSFMDYTIPRADDLPMFETLWNPVETDENPLGVKGVGEIGTMGAPAAAMNAIVDSLQPLGVKEVQMPATSEQIWRAIRTAQLGE